MHAVSTLFPEVQYFHSSSNGTVCVIVYLSIVSEIVKINAVYCYTFRVLALYIFSVKLISHHGLQSGKNIPVEYLFMMLENIPLYQYYVILKYLHLLKQYGRSLQKCTSTAYIFARGNAQS